MKYILFGFVVFGNLMMIASAGYLIFHGLDPLISIILLLLCCSELREDFNAKTVKNFFRNAK